MAAPVASACDSNDAVCVGESDDGSSSSGEWAVWVDGIPVVGYMYTNDCSGSGCDISFCIGALGMYLIYYEPGTNNNPRVGFC